MILYKLKNVLNELPYSRFYELRIIDKIVRCNNTSIN